MLVCVLDSVRVEEPLDGPNVVGDVLSYILRLPFELCEALKSAFGGRTPFQHLDKVWKSKNVEQGKQEEGEAEEDVMELDGQRGGSCWWLPKGSLWAHNG